MKRTLYIGTRGSKLALVQTNSVITLLKQQRPDLDFIPQVIHTAGDKDRTTPLRDITAEGLFVHEIEKALEAGEIDAAIHSLKDLPANLPQGLALAPPPPRADCRDALILKDGISSLKELRNGAMIGTGSPRRCCQLKKLRPDLQLIPIRGNIDTRLSKVGELDGVMLAAAGLCRLGLSSHISEYMEPTRFVPAPCQGILGIEYREDQTELLELFSSISHHDTTVAMNAELAFLKTSGANCHQPIGAWCRVFGNSVELFALFGTEGTALRTGSISGAAQNAADLGRQLAELLCFGHG